MATAPSSKIVGKTIVVAAYALNILGYFSLLPLLISLFINYTKRNDAEGICTAHHRYMLRSFVMALVGYTIGFVTFIFFVGWFIIAATSLWGLYRDVRGVLRLMEGKEP